MGTYHNCGQNRYTDPDTIWKVHDYLAQAYAGKGDRAKELEHSGLALNILDGVDGGLPEAVQQPPAQAPAAQAHAEVPSADDRRGVELPSKPIPPKTGMVR